MRIGSLLVALAGASGVIGCGPADRQSPALSGPDAGDGAGGGGPGVGVPADAAPPPATTFVYAHSSSDLYRIDPDTLSVDHVGPFGWSHGPDQMTDIAIDGTGRIVGISFDHLYLVDSETAQASRVASLDRSFNGLSFVPRPGASGQEVLLGASLDGWVYELDPQTGQSTPRGSYGGGMGSSGDIVSVDGFGTAATVTVLGGGADRLARVDPTDGSAELIGDTGVLDIWGLGFWADKVFGFAEDGRFVLLDVQTGAAQVVESSGIRWWGAGVTTQAEVTVE